MSTDFIPTHRTNRAIGNIKAGTPIRVAQYDDVGFFSDLLGQLGVTDDDIEYRYFKDDVNFWVFGDIARSSRYVLPDDYVITDGEHFEVTGTDFGWEKLPTSEPLAFTKDGEGLYTLQGWDSGDSITVTAAQLHWLSDMIKDSVPESSPIKDARFIHARFVYADEYRTLAKIEGVWYDHNGSEYTEEQVLDNYDEIEVIK